MSEQESTVLASIRGCGAISAVELGRRCGMADETLYGALVALEAKGFVRVSIFYKKATKNERAALWETL